MLSIDFIKRHHLKIDHNEDDEYIRLLQSVAREYIIDTVGTYDETSSRVQLLELCIIGDLYENRQYTVDKFSDKANRTIKSIVLQLQCKEYEDEDY